MNKRIKEKLKFETFKEFCDRADEILSAFKFAIEYHDLTVKEYKDYIYNKHKFSNNEERDLIAKDKCWMWLMSYKYEPMEKEELLSTLNWIGSLK